MTWGEILTREARCGDTGNKNGDEKRTQAALNCRSGVGSRYAEVRGRERVTNQSPAGVDDSQSEGLGVCQHYPEGRLCCDTPC